MFAFFAYVETLYGSMVTHHSCIDYTFGSLSLKRIICHLFLLFPKSLCHTWDKTHALLRDSHASHR